MRCENCGFQMPDSAMFCPKCSHKVGTAANGNNQIEALVKRAKKGDGAAFTELFELTQKKAYYTALKLTKNEYDAQDLLQDAYISAFTSISSLQEDARFESWFNCIVANKCKNYLVKKKPDLFSKYESDDFDSSFEDTLENENSSFVPQDVLDNAETRRLVMQCIDRLSEEQKMCVLMYYYEEMSVAEIATALDISQGTVKTRLFHARKNLKADFEALERGGTKLYGLGVLPLIRLAFSDASPLKKSASAKILKNATAAAVGKGTKATAAAIGAGATKKVIAAAVAGSVAVGGAGAATAVAVSNHKADKATTIVSTIKESTTANMDFVQDELPPTTTTAAETEAVTETEAETTTTTTQKTTENNGSPMQNVSGMDEDMAKTILKGLGYTVKVKYVNTTDKSKDRYVQKTNPAVGEKIGKDKTITLYVYKYKA